MNVSHKCRLYGLLNPSNTEHDVNQTTKNISACKMRLNLTEDSALGEKAAQLREDLIVGIYRLQAIKDGESALYCIGEKNPSEDEFDINKNFNDIKFIVSDSTKNNNLEF